MKAGESSHLETRAPVWRLALIWLGATGLIGGFLVLRLNDRIHPWEHVLHIPNGVTEDEMSGRWIGGDFTSLAISPDDSRFVFGRATGDAEIWDLNELTMIRELDLPDLEEPIDQEHLQRTTPRFLQFDQKGHLFLVTASGEVSEFDPSGSPVTVRSIEPHFFRSLEVSPQGNQIAHSTVSPRITNWAEGKGQPISKFGTQNGGYQGFDWLPNGRHVLFNDYLSVSLIDTKTLSIRYQHFGLGETEPEPGPEEAPRRQWTGFHLDSCLVQNGTRFVTAYLGEDLFSDNPAYSKLRFYETLSGEVLREHDLPDDPRALRTTDDGLVVVLMSPDFQNLIHLFDAGTMEKTGELHFKLVSSFPPRIEASPDHRHLFVGSERSWLVDLADESAPVSLLKYPSNTQKARFTSGGETLVTMQMNLDIDVWKEHRELTPLGAMIHWEYWAVIATGMIGVVGLIIHVGRRTNKQLPRLLWCAVLVLAGSLGLEIADLSLDPVLERVWEPNQENSVGRMIWKTLIALFWLRIIIGLVRLESGWRKTALVLTALGTVLLIGLTLWLWWVVRAAPAEAVKTALDQFTFANGWRPQFPTATVFSFILAANLALIGIWWLLFCPTTRAAFASTSQVSE